MILTSIATFHVGHILKLRPDMGGGWWQVVKVMPKVGSFQSAEVVPLYLCPQQKRQHRHPMEIWPPQPGKPEKSKEMLIANYYQGFGTK